MKHINKEGVEILKNKLFFGSLPAFQSDPLDILIDTCLDNDVTDVAQIAYVLGTAYHESDRFKANEEYGKGSGRDYSKPLLIWRNKFKGYWGRGWVQLTWLGNYGQFTARLSALKGEPIDLVNDPELIVRDPSINAWICVVGMKEGLFTGKGLDDYINGSVKDFYNARRIVNGTKHATDIAAAAAVFEEVLQYG